MKIGITKFIAENIAPSNAKRLAIFNDTKKVCSVDITKMIPTNLGEKLYSIGLLSDVHCAGNSNGGTATDDGNGRGNIPNGTFFNRALSYFEEQGCLFCCVSGDLTNIGFYWEADDTEVYLNQFAEYKQIYNLHSNLTVYELCGNHESYYNRSITENLDLLQEYTGTPLYYTVSNEASTSPLTEGGNIQNTSISDNDIFIFVGQAKDTIPMSNEAFAWLETILESNKNKRCFVFIHSYVDVSDSGNPLGLHATPLFTYWGTTNKNAFIGLMTKYKNAILFHGHSHMEFENQFTVSNANYSTALGFKSIHIPSTAYTRDISTGEIVAEDNGAQGYVCDVYTNHIVLKGYDFQFNTFVPIAQYCIDTKF